MLQLTAQGFSIVSKRPEMVQRLIDLTLQTGREVTDELKSDLERAKTDAAFAVTELENDFPFMHASALVTVWGSLEAAVEDVLVGIALNEPEALQRNEFIKIKVPLIRFDALEREERVRYLITEAQRTINSGAAQGTDTFEGLLALFDLSGEVDESVKKGLWEMNHVRNVIVHRDSQADLRLVQSCPWLGAKVGERVLVNHEKYETYRYAVDEYVKTLFRRLSARYDLPVTEIWLPSAMR